MLLEPYNADDHIVVGNISDDKINRIASLRSGTITHPYHRPHNHSSAQQFTIDSSNRRRSLYFDIAPSCHNRLQSEYIYNKLGDKVVGGARVNKRLTGVIALVA